jgi:hypothetical protein
LVLNHYVSTTYLERQEDYLFCCQARATYHIYSARKNEEWAKLPSPDTQFLNDFCGFFKTVVFSENTFLTEYGRTEKFQEHGHNF